MVRISRPRAVSRAMMTVAAAMAPARASGAGAGALLKGGMGLEHGARGMHGMDGRGKFPGRLGSGGPGIVRGISSEGR